MKKLIALLLAILMIASLCACSETAPETPETTESKTNETTAAQAPEDPTEEATEEATETIPVAVGNADMALAESCIDKSVEELYELIGEPISADYAPSCLDENGEDGILYYENFIVYTYREGDTETIHFVE